jgi:hypothetical protein
MTDTEQTTETPEVEDRGDDLDFSPEELDTLGEQTIEEEQEPEKESPVAQVKPASVPISRFREVNDKYKEAAETAKRLEAELETAQRMPTVDDLRSKEKRYIELTNEGEWDKAAELRMEINASILKTATLQAERNYENRAQMKQAMESSNRIWDENPWLQGNEEAQEDFRHWRVIGENKGLNKSEALDYAVEKVRPLYGNDETQTPDTDKSQKQTAAEDKRPAESLQRAVKDARRQPPPVGGTGARASEAKTREYTDEELANLPKDELARLRGDIV